jgi:hypothetical protein
MNGTDAKKPERIKTISIDKLVPFQTRAKTSDAHIDRLAELISEDVDLGPLIVFLDGGKFLVADGCHRLEAHKRLKRKSWRLMGKFPNNANGSISTVEPGFRTLKGARKSKFLRRVQLFLSHQPISNRPRSYQSRPPLRLRPRCRCNPQLPNQLRFGAVAVRP